MKKKSYYFVRFEAITPQNDFHSIIAKLSTIENVIATSTEDTGLLKYKDNPNVVHFSLVNPAETPFEGATVVLVEADDADVMVVSLCRQVASQLEYRVFDIQNDHFYPKSLGLKEITEITLSEKAAEVFRKKKMTPKYFYGQAEIYAIEHTTQAIHFINPYLLSYFLEFDVDEEVTPEFSYPVASTLKEFTAFYDEGLVPHAFYMYYDKRSLKIINTSEFNVDHIDRKVFVHPFFFVLNQKKQMYEPIAPLDAAIHTYADKVRKGETLDDALKRITSQDLGYAPDYLCAFIVNKIDFDRDKEGILTPRLYIRVYLNEAKITEVHKNKFQRKWTSLGESFH